LIAEILGDKKLIKSFRRSLKRLLYTGLEFFRFDVRKALKLYSEYFLSLLSYVRAEGSLKTINKMELYPCLFDKIAYTPVEPIYFFQNSWAAKHIFNLKPKYIVDIGSPITFLGIISQFVKVFFVDIRPPTIKVRGLEYIKGDIKSLPFKDNSIDFLSSLCVVEHIGLGRYGDEIDPYGTEKALSDMKRVVKKGGILIFSFHVDSEDKIYFNAHRAFDIDYIGKKIEGFEIKDQKYLYGERIYDRYMKEMGFGTAFLCLKKL